MLHLSPLVRVIDDYAILHHITLADLTGLSQKDSIVHLRQEAYYLCFMHPSGPTMRAVATRFHRDRSTVRFGIKKHCTRNGLPLPKFSRYPQGGPKRHIPAPEMQH